MIRKLGSGLLAGLLLGSIGPGTAGAQSGRLGTEVMAEQRTPAFLSLRAQSAQLPMLRRVVEVDFRDVALGDALERIAALAGLRLTYSTDILPPGRMVSLQSRELTAAEALLSALGHPALDILISTDGDAVVVGSIPPAKH